MSKTRKGNSYLGGHTVITLHPRVVEQGLAEQARECKQQQQKAQDDYDTSHLSFEREADRLVHKNRPGGLRTAEAVRRYYEQQIHQIDVLLKGKPIYSAKLVVQQLDLLEKLLKFMNTTEGPASGARRKVIRRMDAAERLLVRLKEVVA